MHSIASEAIVLSYKSYSEADKLVTVFSKDYGMLTFLAKGVKKLKSRKRGALELFSIIKFFAKETKGIPLLTEVEIIDNLAFIKDDLKKISVAYFFAEIVLRTSGGLEKNSQIYFLLRNYLERLNHEKSLKKVRSDFSLKLAQILGFIPDDQFISNPDELLENIIEKKLSSVRVGKRLQK